MKTLNTAVAMFGPFNDIETLEDRYRCDGVDYPFGVIGDATIGEWVQPDPVPAPAQVPQSVSPRQIRQALTRAELRGPVEAAIAAADQDTKDWYEYATAFDRSNLHVAQLAGALGVTEEQLDQLWTLAGML